MWVNMIQISKSARTAHIVHVFSCLCSVLKLNVLSYDENNNLFTCTGEINTLDNNLMTNLCRLIDNDMSVEIQDDDKRLFINKK